jgi:arginyl-tRNA synthetase
MQILKSVVEPLIEQALAQIGITNDHWRSMLAPSRELDQGDLSLPCFPFAKQLGKAPPAIAEAVAEAMATHEAVGEVNAVGGYLNIKASPIWLASTILQSPQTHGHPFGQCQPTGRKILIEHTSANPNGPFHVGRARNAILGDSLVRLHRLYGNEVRAEYYVDDMGKQVGVLAWALKHLSHEEVEEIGRMVHASEHGDQDVLDDFQAAYQPVLDGMLTTLARLGINFDTFTKESMFVTNGDVSRLMEQFRGFDIHGTADNGAEFLDLGARGLKGKTEFFFRRGDGSSLYATRDIAYHMWKWQQCDDLINVLGEDHKLQAKQVGMTLTELGQKVPEVMFYSFIKLPEGKMSTRKGNVVFMDDLLEEASEQAAAVVGVLRPDYEQEEVKAIADAAGTSAVRFNIIKVSPEKGFTFRWEEALAFEGGSAPFVMYSHVRACSIVRRCESEGVDVDAEMSKVVNSIPTEMSSGMVGLLRSIAVHNDVLAKAVNDCRPHLFANQLLNLATCFNAFYRDCMIVIDGEVNTFNLQVSEVARRLMRTGMEGLGIAPIEHM